MTQVLTIVRGLPGSGKSFLARRLAQYTGSQHYEADDYFIQDDGSYVFDASHLSDAHRDCQARTWLALAQGYSVIVANTFTTRVELAPYIHMAGIHGARLQVIECHAQFGSLHGVPLTTILAMRARWEVLETI